MTKASILAYVKIANTAVDGGDCEAAQNAIAHAWSGMSSYRGWGADALRRKVSAAYLRTFRACSERSSGDLLHPSGHDATAYHPGTPVDPYSNPPSGIIPPSFHGPYQTYSKMMPVLGFALATVGLGIGIVTLYRAS